MKRSLRKFLLIVVQGYVEKQKFLYDGSRVSNPHPVTPSD